MMILKCFAVTTGVLPMLVVGIALAAPMDDAFAKSGARPGIGNTETRSPPREGGTVGIVERPAPGNPIDHPLPPIPIDPGRGDHRVGHDGSSDHKHDGRHEGKRHVYDRWYKPRHKHSRYESPPIIGKHTSRESDLFRRGVVGPQAGAGGETTRPVLIGR
ncbi:hypothetical protein [Bradyrhizobium sp. SSUT77]|uniref:hypothetical protein n=1 Tax=Bradyrhizobium sp. SSUT77 TaxID=3040603 RepID=UPI00244AB688|nr:hypothetical protein [Bradyrhizobium sp. SSUT77]MDH2347618.1 hypothetical protein [Bradyrhizobium sp. SSUT77]